MSVQYIPLNRLVASAHNARRTDRKADIGALSASIVAHGLLHNLTVAPTASDRFQVVAGARRHAALKSLAKAGAIARDFAVPCQLIEESAAAEASLAENVHSVAMCAMDEMDAFAHLSEAGLSGDDIAHRFGCTLRHVEQRLALAALSPKLKAAYRRAGLTLDAARAFCIEPDHVKQEAVFKLLDKPITSAASVRAHLCQGRMKASDRLARFVGLEAYENAGGALTRDLFDTAAVFVNDPTLMTRLANERLDAMRADVLEKGWGWVNVNLGNGGLNGGVQRVHARRRAMNEDERQRLDEIDAALAALDEQLEATEDDDPRWEERDSLAACRHAALEATLDWDKDLIAHAGIVISINYEGKASFAYGLVAKADLKKVNRLLAGKARAATSVSESEDDPALESATSSATSTPPWEDEPGPRLPKALARELTAARAAALRLELSRRPDAALALAVAALARRAFSGYPITGVELSAHAVTLDDHDAFGEGRAALGEAMPQGSDALLDWSLAQSRETLLEALAIIVAGALDLSHEGASFDDRRKQALADQTAAAIDLDMARYWKAGEAFWSRLPKAMLLDALAGAPSVAGLPEAERAAFLKAQAKLKRDDLAKHVAQAFDGAGWLPDILVTPIATGALSVTAEGAEAAAAIAAE